MVKFWSSSVDPEEHFKTSTSNNRISSQPKEKLPSTKNVDDRLTFQCKESVIIDNTSKRSRIFYAKIKSIKYKYKSRMNTSTD